MILPDNHLLQLRIQVVGEFHAEPFGARLEPGSFVMLHWSLDDCRSGDNLGNLTQSAELGPDSASLMVAAWRGVADRLCLSYPIQPSML